MAIFAEFYYQKDDGEDGWYHAPILGSDGTRRIDGRYGEERRRETALELAKQIAKLKKLTVSKIRFLKGEGLRGASCIDSIDLVFSEDRKTIKIGKTFEAPEGLTPVYAVEFSKDGTSLWSVQKRGELGIYHCIPHTKSEALNKLKSLEKEGCVWGKARLYGWKERGFQTGEYDLMHDLKTFGEFPEGATDYR